MSRMNKSTQRFSHQRHLAIQSLEKRVVLAASVLQSAPVAAQIGVYPDATPDSNSTERGRSISALESSSQRLSRDQVNQYLQVETLAEGEQVAPVPKSGYELNWFDDFSGSSLDASKWNAIDTNITTNYSLQDYRPSQVSVSNGNLVITSENTPSRGLPYLSGQVTSTALQKYGRFEVRAKLPTSRGMWPAIWLLPDTPNWPSQGEIDIMENRGDQPTLTSSAFHWGTNPPYRHEFVYNEQQAVSNGQFQNYHDSFHDYAVEWDPDQIRFYVDDVHHFTVYDQDTGGFLSSNVGEMRLVINTAIGGAFLDNPDASTQWDQAFEIDHVYAFTKSQSPRVLTFENGGFDQNAGSVSGWTTFGNPTNNVSTAQPFAGAESEALKLYGQFNGQENYSGVQQGITVTGGDIVTAGADAYVSSLDSIAGTGNRVVMNIDYFSEQHGLFGSPTYLGSESILLADGGSDQDVWLSGTISSTVPTNAVEARLAFVFVQRGEASGSVFVDNAQLQVLPTMDYGDAPSTYPVTQALNGAAHTAIGPRLGAMRDAEDDGQSSPLGDGDGSDEDGVMFGTISSGNSLAAVNIDLQNAPEARIDAWLDFDGDGVWQDDEKILDSVLVTNVPGYETLNFAIHADAVPGETFARVRISSVGGLSVTGDASDGEVEDYRVSIVAPPAIAAITINDDDRQRSSLRSVEITFDHLVDIDINDTGEDPFELINVDSGQSVSTLSTIDHSSGTTVVNLTFAENGSTTTRSGSLKDGDYQLKINASLFTYLGVELDGTGNGLAGGDRYVTAADGLFRKYGDQDGNGSVDLTDFAAFRSVFGLASEELSFVEGLDADGDGRIGLTDFAAFRGNFGR